MTIRLLDLLSLSQPILYTGIFSYLDPPDILRLLSTCKTLRAFVPELWNINRTLRRFVDDPVAFRSLMARHDALVSGSLALQFLAREKWVNSDLDVYITGDNRIVRFAMHLVKNEGYEFAPYSWQSREVLSAVGDRVKERAAYIAEKQEKDLEFDFDADEIDSEAVFYTVKEIDGVFNFVHKTNPKRRIQLISSKLSPINSIMADYYATHIFNFFTWNRAYSLFPYHTFGKREAFYTQVDCTGRTRRGIEKYIDRGFEAKHYGKYHTCVKNCPFRPHRRVADKYSWVLDLDTYGVDTSEIPVPPEVIEMNTWGMKMHNSWWKAEDNYRVFSSKSCMEIHFWCDKGTHMQHSAYHRLYDNHINSWADFVDEMKKKVKDLKPYRLGPTETELKAGGREWETILDKELGNWYRFWETSIMPYENMWKWQYPVLGEEVTVVKEGVVKKEQVQLAISGEVPQT